MYLLKRIIGDVTIAENIAVGRRIRDFNRLVRRYGRWRKVKGIALVELTDGRICTAELHWYEAHGVGRFELKVKRVLNYE